MALALATPVILAAYQFFAGAAMGREALASLVGTTVDQSLLTDVRDRFEEAVEHFAETSDEVRNNLAAVVQGDDPPRTFASLRQEAAASVEGIEALLRDVRQLASGRHDAGVRGEIQRARAGLVRMRDMARHLHRLLGAPPVRALDDDGGGLDPGGDL